jgi:hypothetical protein
LERRLVLVEQRPQQPGAVAEAAEQRALADARSGGDRVHRDLLDVPLREQPGGRAQDPVAVASRVGTLARLAGDGQLERARRLDRR